LGLIEAMMQFEKVFLAQVQAKFGSQVEEKFKKLALILNNQD
ncbi:42911_t:CDS:1, partial [Gigaspora margarita]